MRAFLILALVVGICAACADEPAQDGTMYPVPDWLTNGPENAHPYARDTLARFGKLVEESGWGDAAWNTQGTLEAIHQKTGLAFVLIPGGDFLMGSPVTEAERNDTEDRHHETVPALLLCKTECTQRAWVRGGGKNWSRSQGDDLPVEFVAWGVCRGWCAELGLRLPGEAEWEYACRAGTNTPFSTGFTLTTDQANYNGNYPYGGDGKGEFRERTVKAGSLPPNPWGLHEMHGNLLEWCVDWTAKVTRFGKGFAIYRGGNWNGPAKSCRSAVRYGSPGWATPYLTFRPAADLPE